MKKKKMSKNRFSKIERLGVNKVEQIFLDDFEWIPRTIFQTDVGIDMNVEIAEEGMPTGQFIAVQIKSGQSFFKEEVIGDIIYRGKSEHLKYWLNYSLPVIIVLYHPDKDLTIWQEVNEEKITRTKKGWKIEIPLSNKLSANFKKKLTETNKLSVYYQRLQKLVSDKKLIEYVQKDNLLILEIEEWINKSSGKATIDIIKNINGEDVLISKFGYFHFNIETSLQVLFPWADFEIDDDYYYDQEEEEFIANYGVWDYEDKSFVGTREDFSEHRKNYPKIRPLEDGSGEIHIYRLIFSLNQLGKSFIKVNNYMEFGM